MMVAAPEKTRKAPKAYYCILDDVDGILTQLEDNVLYFLANDTAALTVITPAMCPFLMPLGEVGLAETQHMLDTIRGGAARICTMRAMETQ